MPPALSGPVGARPLTSSATVPWPIEKTWKPPESVMIGALDRVRLVADLDRDAARLALLGLRDPHLQDAAVEARLDRVGVDALGQRQRAAERAVRALDAEVALLLLLLLGLALTGDREDVVLDLDVHVLLGEPRKVGLQDEVLVGLDEIHRRDPATKGRP